ncbi:hypothetical protein [Litorihabitans aurantiacus]|uniref:Uncharacterized protein n=1 Tax=Litorihabitans aurantiacus TaxID=1930061 RepID=A0AA37XDN7_9MICO|nr:hypothetical protein [Litorihabitans aurantiacus]GMA30317.1 hypothetical protein GCM10025875_03090 [Litorihabitans aurantiacus]
MPPSKPEQTPRPGQGSRRRLPATGRLGANPGSGRSTQRSPQGSKQQPPRPGPATFRRRRLTLAVLVVLVLAGIAAGVWALVATLGVESADDAAPGTTPTSGTTPGPTDEPGSPGATAPEPSEPETTEYPPGSTPPPPTGCTPEQASIGVDAPAAPAWARA